MRFSMTTALTLCATTAQAHFGMIIPSDTMIAQEEGRALGIDVAFGHPFTPSGMAMQTPAAFTVTRDGTTTDLSDTLSPRDFFGATGFQTVYTLGRPGTYVFALTPQPYWEPAEGVFILHYTKTYVTAFDDDAGWDTELGLPTEIVPLSKPFGLWSGNVFQGVVKIGGKPAPHAEVEVEHFNQSRAVAPSEIMITQTIRADGNGVFTYAAPAPGWWGFAALSTADETLAHEGEEKPVELGAVIWVHFEPWLTQ